MTKPDFGQVDGKLWAHPKARKAGLPAMGLWALCLSHSIQYKTEGFVSSDAVVLIGGDAGPELAARLVTAKLWVTADGGFRFHDWEHYHPQKVELAPAAKKAPSVRPYGRRIPEGWTPSLQVIAWCHAHGVDGAAHVDEFVDHWQSTTKNAAKVDWDATFRSWIRNCIKFDNAKPWVAPRAKRPLTPQIPIEEHAACAAEALRVVKELGAVARLPADTGTDPLLLFEEATESLANRA